MNDTKRFLLFSCSKLTEKLSSYSTKATSLTFSRSSWGLLSRSTTLSQSFDEIAFNSTNTKDNPFTQSLTAVNSRALTHLMVFSAKIRYMLGCRTYITCFLVLTLWRLTYSSIKKKVLKNKCLSSSA